MQVQEGGAGCDRQSGALHDNRSRRLCAVCGHASNPLLICAFGKDALTPFFQPHKQCSPAEFGLGFKFMCGCSLPARRYKSGQRALPLQDALPGGRSPCNAVVATCVCHERAPGEASKECRCMCAGAAAQDGELPGGRPQRRAGRRPQRRPLCHRPLRLCQRACEVCFPSCCRPRAIHLHVSVEAGCAALRCAWQPSNACL